MSFFLKLLGGQNKPEITEKAEVVENVVQEAAPHAQNNCCRMNWY